MGSDCLAADGPVPQPSFGMSSSQQAGPTCVPTDQSPNWRSPPVRCVTPSGVRGRRTCPASTARRRATSSLSMPGWPSPARIGRNLLGDRAYADLITNLGAGSSLIFVGATGLVLLQGDRVPADRRVRAGADRAGQPDLRAVFRSAPHHREDGGTRRPGVPRNRPVRAARRQRFRSRIALAPRTAGDPRHSRSRYRLRGLQPAVRSAGPLPPGGSAGDGANRPGQRRLARGLVEPARRYRGARPRSSAR